MREVFRAAANLRFAAAAVSAALPIVPIAPALFKRSSASFPAIAYDILRAVILVAAAGDVRLALVPIASTVSLKPHEKIAFR